MKNTLKGRIAPLFGIIAIVAVIGFMMTACGEPEEALEDFPNPVAVAWEYGAYTGKAITAEYNGGKVQVNYSWFKTTDTAPIAGETNATFTPTEAGTYYVRATDKATFGNKGFKNSNNITVKAAPEYIGYFGKWLMKGVDNKWEPETGKGDSYNETITLYADRFKLDSTYDNEYLYFNISNWTKIASAALSNVVTANLPASVGQNPNQIGTAQITYAEGWTLNLNGGTTRGYGDTAAAYTVMNLYKTNATSQSEIRRTSGTATPTAQSPVIARVYVKQAE